MIGEGHLARVGMLIVTVGCRDYSFAGLYYFRKVPLLR